MNDVKKAKNYFNEDEFIKLLKQYQNSIVFNKKGEIIKKDEKIELELVKRVDAIIKAIIMIYRYYIFEDYEDLKQHALHACFKNFIKYDPSKGTAFNYFSIIAKKSLLNYTTRRKKHRELHNIDDYVHLSNENRDSLSVFLDNFEGLLLNIINENYTGKKRKDFIKIATVLVNYFRHTNVFVSKTDMYSWTRSYGIKNAEVRNFINEMQKYNSKIFALVEDNNAR